MTDPDHAPAIPGDWGVDTDPETADDSRGTEGGSYPPEVLDPPPAEEQER